MKSLPFYIRLVAALLALGSSATTRAQEIDLSSALKRSNEIFLATRDIRPYLLEPKVLSRLSSWLNHERIQAYVVDCQFHMRAYFRSERLIGPLCYFLRQDDGTRRRLALTFARRYILEVGAALHELAHDPRYSAAERNKAASWVAQFERADFAAVEKCFNPALKATYPEDGSLPFSPFTQVAQCFHQSLPKIDGSPYFAVNIAKVFPHHPGHALSPTGWLPGNKIQYFYWNNVSKEAEHGLDQRHDQMRRYYPLNGAGSYEAMLAKDPRQVFTKEEGFFTIDTDPVWTEAREGAIFPGIKAALDRAKESVFIDIFFLGSSMGASLAKHLVDMAERGIKVLILRDNYNHLGHQAEMLPIYNYLLAYSWRNPDKMVVTSAYIKAHTSGLPSFMAPVMSDEFLEKSGLQEHLMIYGRIQSDHSKVFVIDGKSANPIALVGSKNLTDASGGITYDEVVQVEGPAAAAVLDDYYWDMAYALLYEQGEAFVRHWAQNGWSKTSFKAGQSREEMVANILRPFDLLERDAFGRANPRAVVKVSSRGQALVRTGMNNVDSTRTNCVDQVVQMILRAKKNIYIKDQFLFERNVVLALMRSKKANPSLDIKVLLEPLYRSKPEGMPNLLYLDALTSLGIEVRWKKMLRGEGSVHQEYHMKTTSADGQSVISGSANKDQTTMFGSLREQQLDIWDAGATKVHDDVLRAHWNDDESTPFTGYDFVVPSGLKGLDGKPMQPGQFVALLRNIVSVLFDAQQL